jgi:hypothetical protein
LLLLQKIRDDKGYWGQVEAYITEKTERKLTHGICPDGLEEHYSELK